MTVSPPGLVEAVLFSAGKPLTVEELGEATHLKPEEVHAALKQLQADYGERPGALEVVKSGAKWAMAVRTEYAEHAKKLAPPEIPRKVLKTLVLIAFHQPIKQADLKDMVGSVVYDHVKELHERGMITAREAGVTKVLSTTERFAEYFGLDASNRDEIRTELARRVGLDLTQVPKKSAGEPPAPDAEAPPPDSAAPADRAEAAATL